MLALGTGLFAFVGLMRRMKQSCRLDRVFNLSGSFGPALCLWLSQLHSDQGKFAYDIGDNCERAWWRMTGAGGSGIWDATAHRPAARLSQ